MLIERDDTEDTFDGDRASDTVTSRETDKFPVDSSVGVEKVGTSSLFGGGVGASSDGASDIENDVLRNEVSKDLSAASGTGADECIDGDGIR